MTLAEAVITLLEIKDRDALARLERIGELDAAFRIFWASRPTEDEFARVMGHSVLTARMLHIMIASRA